MFVGNWVLDVNELVSAVFSGLSPLVIEDVVDGPATAVAHE